MHNQRTNRPWSRKMILFWCRILPYRIIFWQSMSAKTYTRQLKMPKKWPSSEFGAVEPAWKLFGLMSAGWFSSVRVLQHLQNQHRTLFGLMNEQFRLRKKLQNSSSWTIWRFVAHNLRYANPVARFCIFIVGGVLTLVTTFSKIVESRRH